MSEHDKIATNLRLLRILETVSCSEQGVTPSALGQALGMPKPTIHRLCKTLLEERFLVQDPSSKRLRPARRARSLASGLLFNSGHQSARHQVLVKVARQVQETVNFVVPEDEGMFYLDRVETDWSFQVKLPIGTHVPFHNTASGKTYLAWLPSRVRAATVRALSLTKLTKNTHSDAESPLRELKTIKRQGFAIDNEEFIEGMVAIAVPVLDDQGRYAASLAFHGPVQRISIDLAIARKDVLHQAAEELSALFFQN